MIKKGFMMHVWRIQQSSAFINLIMWSLTLTAVLFNDYVKPHFISWGIITEEQYGIGMVMLFAMVFVGVLIAGWVYDRILQLWREQAIVTVERNPFAQERQTPKEILNWEMHQIPMLRRHGLDAEADFNTRWNYRTMRIDPLVKEEVLRILRTVRDAPLPEPHEQYLRAALVEKDGKWHDGTPLKAPGGFHHCTECKLLVDAPRNEGHFSCPRCRKKQSYTRPKEVGTGERGGGKKKEGHRRSPGGRKER